jgi:hypothetical protein
MWFDAQAALASIAGGEKPPLNPAPQITPATPNVANVADVAGGGVSNPPIQRHVEQVRPAFPYGASVGGRPLTHTGRVVSLEAWRALTACEKHGPLGRQ